MKTHNVFRWFIGITFLSCLMGQGAYAYNGKDSRNGDDHPSQGSIRVLVVFAEVTGDPNYNNDTWPWMAGQMPPDADKMFDVDWLTLSGGTIGGGMGPLGKPVTPVGPPSSPSKRFSCFFYDASFGQLRVKGDYYPELIQIPYSRILDGENYNVMVMNSLMSKPNPMSATGLKIPTDFDAWTSTGSYLAKNNTPDGKIDNLIIIWRVNSCLTTVHGSGHWVGLAQSNCTQTIYTYDLTNVVVTHEFSHGPLGDNQYHNGGAGAGTRHFMTNVGGYGIIESYNHNLRSCNAWERYRLGWKKNDTYPDIYAHDLEGNIVNGDILYRVPSAADIKAGTMQAPDEYVLQDFLTTGDAIRIQLPYMAQGGFAVDPQWIWIENHVSDTGKVYYPNGASHPMGVRINLQVGNEGFNNFNSRPNYYVPFSRFGRWDFDISRVAVNRASGIGTNPPYIPPLDSIWIFQMGDNAWYKAYTTSDKSNAFTGNSLLESMKYDANGDDKLQDREDVTIKEVYKDNVRIGGDHPIFGNVYDIFRVGDTLSLATNPATTPWLTHKTVTGDDGCTPTESRDNRKIYLNGLRIHIKEQRADGSVVVAVTQGYYNVNQDQRWCGDIVLNERINLGAGKKINFTLGQTPIVKTNPIPLGNKRYFTEPTVLTCKANSVLFFDRNAEIDIDNRCALVLKKGCIVWKKSTSSIATIHVKAGGTLIVESGVTFKNGTIMLKIDAGAYACVDGTVISNFNIENYGIINDIHPYLRQVKGFSCGSGKGAKSGYAEDEPEDDVHPVYQSFFEGNPVYYQTWENSYFADAAGGRIEKHGLEGDTEVDGLQYHILSVKGNGGDWEDGHRVPFWVRESEAHDKVWVRLPWDKTGQEFLAVDMTLDKGDTFVMDREIGAVTVTLCDTTWDTVGNAMIIRCKDTVIDKEICYVVDSVYYLEHPGGVLKHIRLSPQDYNEYTYILESTPVNMGRCDWKSRHLEFIEGVGSNLGFVYGRLGNKNALWKPLSPVGEDNIALLDYIVCMERDSLIYYEHPNPECAACNSYEVYQWIYEPDDPREPSRPPKPANERVQSMSRHLLLSPNPAAETATLQWAASADSRVAMAACRITLYDLQGVRLRSYTTDRWPYTLSVSDLTPGGYLLCVVPAEPPADGAWQATVRLMVR